MAQLSGSASIQVIISEIQTDVHRIFVHLLGMALICGVPHAGYIVLNLFGNVLTQKLVVSWDFSLSVLAWLLINVPCHQLPNKFMRLTAVLSAAFAVRELPAEERP